MEKMISKLPAAIREFIDMVYSVLIGRGTEKESTGDVLFDVPNELTRQNLLDYLEQFFTASLSKQTTKSGLLFDTSYTIYLNDQDYNDLEQSFGFTVKEAVNLFHSTIVKLRGKYPDYTPHATYWEFQFVPFKPESIIEGMKGEVDSIPRKKALCLSCLLPTKGRDATAANGPQRATVTLRNGKDSLSLDNLAINSEALSNVTILARDRFQVDFNNFSQLREDAMSDELRQTSGYDARATITVSGAKFLLSGGGYAEAVYMNSDNLLISGRGGIADTTGGIPVIRIDSDKVMDNHLRLRYDPNTHKLFMISQSEVLLHERRVSPNVEKELYNHSRIVVVGDIQLEITNIKTSNR